MISLVQRAQDPVINPVFKFCTVNSEPSRSIHAGFVLYRRNDAIEAASIASFRLAGFVLYRRNDAIEPYPIASFLGRIVAISTAVCGPSKDSPGTNHCLGCCCKFGYESAIALRESVFQYINLQNSR